MVQPVPLSLPAGMRQTGTEYQARGRWVNGDRVRWENGSIRPIGGWTRFEVDTGPLDRVFSDTDEVSRAMMSWRTNDGGLATVIATNKKLYGFRGRDSATLADITPTGFVPVVGGLQINIGYGGWVYGRGAYGTSRPSIDASGVFNWCLRLWGEDLLAMPRSINNQGIYRWELTPATPAAPITGDADLPTYGDAMHVTEQRIVMVAGTFDEPRLIKWSDSEDFSTWVPAVDNQAGFQTLPGRGSFREITEYRNEILLISETDAHVARYIGPPYVFGFDKAGDNCGTISGNAVVNAGRFVVWPSQRKFFVYDGAVQELECEVLDKVSDALLGNFASAIVGFHNPMWSEVWWLIPIDGSTEVNGYVYWNYETNHWGTGTINRTVGCLGTVPGEVFMMSQDGYLYEHEQIRVPPYFNNLSEIYLESGPIEIANGAAISYIRSIFPDFNDSGEVDVTFLSSDQPEGPEIAYGPYRLVYPPTINQPTPTRARGRTIKVRIESAGGCWCIGDLRLDMASGGVR